MISNVIYLWKPKEVNFCWHKLKSHHNSDFLFTQKYWNLIERTKKVIWKFPPKFQLAKFTWNELVTIKFTYSYWNCKLQRHLNPFFNNFKLITQIDSDSKTIFDGWGNRLSEIIEWLQTTEKNKIRYNWMFYKIVFD